MKMSKYWDKMLIMREKQKTSSLFISQQRPIFFVNKEDYTFKTSSSHNFTDKELENISKFYFNNYSVETNYTIELSKDDLQRYLHIDSEITIIEKKYMIGSIISVLVPVKICTNLNTEILIKSSNRLNKIKNDKSIVFGYTSFFILHKKYRNKGLGMSLIQKSSQLLYDIGGLCVYFINSVSRCINSVPLFSWYFPLNLTKLNQCKYPYPQNSSSIFFLSTSEHIKTLKINKNNAEEALNFYRNSVKDKKFYFDPSLTYWKKWIDSFPTYLVIRNSIIIGIFSFNSYSVRYPIYKTNLIQAMLLICVGVQPETLNASLIISKKSFDLLILYELGELNHKLLSSISAQKYDVKNFINFFNVCIRLKASEMYVPIF